MRKVLKHRNGEKEKVDTGDAHHCSGGFPFIAGVALSPVVPPQPWFAGILKHCLVTPRRKRGSDATPHNQPDSSSEEHQRHEESKDDLLFIYNACNGLAECRNADRGARKGEHGSDHGEKATASIDRGITLDSQASAPPPHY